MDDAQTLSTRVWTVPNILSMLRLLALPLFVWLLAGHHDLAAFIVLALSGVTDYLDGKIARATGQITRLGQLLDPLADRLYILTTVIGLGWRGILPWWLVGILLVREVLIAALGLPLRRYRLPVPPVHFIGKAATFNLIYGLPLVLLGEVHAVQPVVRPLGWAFVWWGTALYWVAGIMYVVQIAGMIRAVRHTQPA